MNGLKIVLPGCLALLCLAAPLSASPILGLAQGFSVIGASAVTNTGPTAIFGDLGLFAGTSITGLAQITIGGTVHQTDALAQQGKADALAAYTQLAGRPFVIDLTGQNLGGLTLQPGVYHFDSSAQLTGTLTLDATGILDALFLFQIGSALTTASSAAVNVINGNSSTGVFWQVGSSATLGTGSIFAGNILADQSITMNTAASIVCGRAIALNAAVTMDSNSISNDCNNTSGGLLRTDFGSAGFSGRAAAVVAVPVPEPASAVLMLTGLLMLGGILHRWRKGASGHYSTIRSH